MSNEELKPCRCGNEIVTVKQLYTQYRWTIRVVECDQCGECLPVRTAYLSQEDQIKQCYQAWNDQAPITREQVDEWADKNSFALVPVEPTHKMLIILFDQWESEGRMTMTDNYKAMIKAAQENSNE